MGQISVKLKLGEGVLWAPFKTTGLDDAMVAFSLRRLR
jgi:hypothetical protein